MLETFHFDKSGKDFNAEQLQNMKEILFIWLVFHCDIYQVMKLNLNNCETYEKHY